MIPLERTSRVKPVEYVALNTHKHCMKIVCFRQSSVFGSQFIENEFWMIVLWTKSSCGKSSRYLTPCIIWLEGDKWGCWFQRTSILRTQRQLSCRTSSLITLLGMAFDHHDHQALSHLTSFCGGFPKERVYSNNTRSLENFKHNTEGTIAGIDQ